MRWEALLTALVPEPFIELSSSDDIRPNSTMDTKQGMESLKSEEVRRDSLKSGTICAGRGPDRKSMLHVYCPSLEA